MVVSVIVGMSVVVRVGMVVGMFVRMGIVVVVRMRMPVVMALLVGMVVTMIVRADVLTILLVVVVVRMSVDLPVRLVVVMRLSVDLPMLLVVVMRVSMPGRMSMVVAGRRMHGLAVDRHAVRAAAAGRTHHAISMSFTRNSSPATTRSTPPQAQRPNGDDNAIVLPHVLQIARPGVSRISSSAPSTVVPWAQIPKQNRSEVRQHRRKLADFQPHAQHPGAGRAFGAGVHHRGGEAEFVHLSSLHACQQIRGNCSPTSISTMRSPPNAVCITTIPAGSRVTSPMIAASAPAG